MFTADLKITEIQVVGAFVKEIKVKNPFDFHLRNQRSLSSALLAFFSLSSRFNR